MNDPHAALTTRPYVLEERPVKRLVKRHMLRQRLVISGFMVLGVLASALVRNSDVLICAATVVVFWGTGLWWGYFFHARPHLEKSRKDGLFSIPRWNVIDEEFFSTYLQDGTYFKQKLKGLFKRGKFRDEHYFLCNSSGGGITMIPARAFQSEADRERFEQLLADKGVPVARRK